MKYYFVALLGVLLDQSTKAFIHTKMKLYASVMVIDNFFYITSHRNRGAAFGILQDKYIFFLTIASIVVILLIYTIWKWREDNGFILLALSFILGGALGNLVDRIHYGEVTDFLDFRFGTYHFPIFNAADSLIVIGVTLLIIVSLFYPQLIMDKDTISNGNRKD